MAVEFPAGLPVFLLYKAIVRQQAGPLYLDKRWPQLALAIPLFRESYRSGRQCAVARLPLKSRTAQPENTRSGARAQELARNGLEFGLERVVFADGDSYNIYVRILWNFLSHARKEDFCG